MSSRFTNSSPNSPPTSENRFTNVRLSVRVGGLLGLSGIDIRQFINTVPTAGSYKNSPGFNYGLMVVFASYYILQMCIDSSATTIKVRVYIDKNWSNWKSIPL
jgi:hypothetical protein